jgi:cation transport regulator ChaB
MAAKTTVGARAGSASARVTKVYDTDYHAWLACQARAMREGRLEAIDTSNLAEELEDMARSVKKALKSQLVRLIAHLLKWSVQKDYRQRNPSAGHRWLASIRNARDEIKEDLDESPSLKSYLPAVFEKAYRAAVNSAIEDTGLADTVFPSRCPWPLDDILTDDFLPD